MGVAILPAGRTGEALRRALQNIAGNVWSCVAAPIQYAALVAYDNDPELDAYIELCTRMHQVRTHYLYDRLVEAGVPCVEPSGAFYLFPNFNRWKKTLASLGIKGSVDLALYLLKTYELATLPGSAFGTPRRDLSLRLSSSYLDAGTDEKATNLVEVFRADPDPVRFIEMHHPRLHEAATRFAEFVADLERKREQKHPGDKALGRSNKAPKKKP